VLRQRGLTVQTPSVFEATGRAGVVDVSA